MEGKSHSELALVGQIGEEFPYGFRFSYRDPCLEASLEKMGILSPILVKEDTGKRATVVSGHKRVFFARARKWDRIPVFLLGENFSEKEWFLLALYANWNQAFPDLDRMEAIRKAEKTFGFTPEEIRDQILPALGLKEGSGFVKEGRRVMALSDEIHKLIHEKKIPFRGASSLARFSEEEQNLLARTLFHATHFTTNQLHSLTEWLSDLRKIQGVRVESLLQEKPIQTALENPNLNLRARGEKVFEVVRTLRFPRLSAEEESFARVKREFEPMNDIHLEHPQGFETEGVLLRAEVKNRESLGRVLEFLKSHRQSLESLLS